MSEPEVPRSLIVVGASAGGVEALTHLIGAMPGDLPAAIAVVLHLPPAGPSLLPAILNRAGALRAFAPAGGEPLEDGRVYVAPPDHHMLVEDGSIVLRHGPRENGHRPAVDALFMSAAAARGHNVIGVVLTGTLDDGAAGLVAIKSHGGLAVVQDPTDALYPGMPTSALERVEADHVVPLRELGALLVGLVSGDPAPDDEERVTVTEPRTLARHTPSELDAGPGMAAGEAAGLSCPECGGALWYVDESGGRRYRCRIGHAYGEQSLVEEQGRTLEIALWTALRALEERAALMRRMAHRAQRGGHRQSAERFLAHAVELDDRAAVVREHVVPAATGTQAEASA